MNPIEPGTSSSAGLESSAATSTAAGAAVSANAASTESTTASSGATPTSASSAASPASSVSQELQAVKQSTTAASKTEANEQHALMHKVLDTLVSVVSAMVTLVSTLMNQLKGTPPNSSAGTKTGTGSSDGSSATTGSNGSANGSNGSSNQGATGGTVGQTPSVGTNAGAPIVRSALDVNRNDAGMISVRTLDGYTVRAEGRDQAWTITGPDGKTTRIWGDPHVTESDGDKWDFVNRSTFMFGKNKATVEVVPAGNGQTFSARVTVYSDYERVTIDGIEKNQPNIIAASTDGLQHDASLADGEIYKRVVTPAGESWVSVATGKTVPVQR